MMPPTHAPSSSSYPSRAASPLQVASRTPSTVQHMPVGSYRRRPEVPTRALPEVPLSRPTPRTQSHIELSGKTDESSDRHCARSPQYACWFAPYRSAWHAPPQCSQCVWVYGSEYRRHTPWHTDTHSTLRHRHTPPRQSTSLPPHRGPSRRYLCRSVRRGIARCFLEPVLMVLSWV